MISIVVDISIIRQLSGVKSQGRLIMLINVVYWGPLARVEARIIERVPSMKIWLSQLGDVLYKE